MTQRNRETRATDRIELETSESDSVEGVPYLVVLAGDCSGKVIRLRRNATFITGRTRECDLCFDCENISRKHACFELDNLANTTLTDLGSTNGTIVNGKKITTALLNNGDRICMGDIILRYSYQDSLEFDLQRDLYNKATRDALTGAFNKRYFKENFHKEFSFHRRQNLPLSLIILDLDDFKKLNDTYGHVNGDIVLKSLAKEINSCMRREDIFARFGGEEFVALFRCTPHATAITIAKKLVELISTMKFSTSTIEFNTSATVGLATLEDGNFNSPEELLIKADQNLYEGKHSGKNKVVG